MSLRESIMDDVKSAMKAKDQALLSTLRFLQSAIKNKEIEVRPNSITEQDVLSVLKKLVKQRKDSIEQFENAGREDLAEKERFELKVLSQYMPEEMDASAVEKLVQEVIAKVNAQSIKDMGAVMKEVLAQANGAADSKLVSDIVRKKLQ